MRKVISFMHVSLDGFTTGPNGELEWAIVDEEDTVFIVKGLLIEFELEEKKVCRETKSAWQFESTKCYHHLSSQRWQ